MNKQIINKLREKTKEIVTTINNQTYSSNDGFKYFSEKSIYDGLEEAWIDGFNKGLLTKI